MTDRIDMCGFPSGMYSLVIRKGDKFFTFMVVVN